MTKQEELEKAKQKAFQVWERYPALKSVLEKVYITKQKLTDEELEEFNQIPVDAYDAFMEAGATARRLREELDAEAAVKEAP